MTGCDHVEWWGVIDAANWKEPTPSARLESLWGKAAMADAVDAHRLSTGQIMVRWKAPDDRNAAYRVLHDALGADPMDFDPSRRAERVAP